MKSGKRFLLRVVLPPACGAVLVSMTVIFERLLAEHSRPISVDEALAGFCGLLFFAYVFASLPSVLFAGLMALWDRIGPARCRWGALALSTGLGLACGGVWLIGELTGGRTTVSPYAWVFAAAGALTGFGVEWLVGRTFCAADAGVPGGDGR
jgi:hypothetical protein